jgi:hypothetical protein
MNGFDVDTDGLRSHASALRAIGADLEKGADAGKTTMIQDDAFGILCSFLVPPALMVQGACSGIIAASAVAVDGTAIAIRTVADGYDAIEDAVSGLMAGLADLIPTK